MVREAVAGTELAVFISHGHADHLHEDLASVTNTAASVRYVLSDDVEEMRPQAVPGNGEVLSVEPDETYELGGMTIETLMSNDLGVAFLVEDGDFRFYFGGDLAKWIWGNASEAEASFTTRFFREALERVKAFGPQVAFCNVDKRLPNLAGGDEACRVVAPPIFVPMHTFGETELLQGLRDSLADVDSRLFIYSRPGESESFDI